MFQRCRWRSSRTVLRLVHEAPTSGSGTSATRTGDTRLTPRLYVACHVQPTLTLPDFVYGLVDPKESFRRAFMHLLQYVLRSHARGDYLDRFLLLGRLPVTFQYTISHCKRFPLGSIALADGAPVTNVLPLRAFCSSHLPK
jgi:hypothetical protein